MKHLLFLLSLLTLVSCSEPRFTLEGEFTDHAHDGRTLWLAWRDPINFDHIAILDSTVVGTDGRYRFEGQVPDTLTALTLRFRPASADPHEFDSFSPLFFVEEGIIHLSSDSNGNNLKLTGTPINEAYNHQVLDAYSQMRARHEVLTRECFDTLMISYAQFIRSIAGSPAGDLITMQYPADRYPEADREYLLSRVSPEVLRRQFVKDSLRDARMQQFQQSKAEMRVGAPYRDIAGITPAGDSIRLSQLLVEGHVTLIDFWASWCGPCRQLIPKFKGYYEKYHPQGFDIVGISLDTNDELWHKALDKEQMPWPQLSDLKGFSGSITQDYAIQAIPYIILVDRTGHISLINRYEDYLTAAIEAAL